MYRNVLVKGDISCGVFVSHGFVKQVLFEFIRNIWIEIWENYYNSYTWIKGFGENNLAKPPFGVTSAGWSL